MINISSIELFNALKDKVGEREAKMLTEYVEYRIADAFDKARDYFATKEDLVRVQGSLETKIAEMKSDLLKWMIVLFAPFYIGMIVFLIKQFL